ncbi:MAG: SpoIID/LytB domain-containing protein [Ilumatobacteraceae bacterium]
MTLTRRLLPLLSGALLASGLVALAPVAPVVAAPGDPNEAVAIVVHGQGSGHGRGLSQYGALGWAIGRGDGVARDYNWILDHYYSDTVMGSASVGQRITVRMLSYDGASQVSVIAANSNAQWSLNGVVQPGSYASIVARKVSGSEAFDVWGFPYAVCPTSTDPLAWWQYLGRASGTRSSAILGFSVPDGDTPATLAANTLGLCSSTGAVTHYRGKFFATFNIEGAVRLVNDVEVESYLRGVVPRESPALWGDWGYGLGINALRAQAVAARSYALAQNRYSPYAKTCDTDSCQVYGGAASRPSAGAAATNKEHANTDRAISDTALMIRVRTSAPSVPVSTEFSSSNGARTAGVNFPPVDDAGDQTDFNPFVRWTRVLDMAGLASRAGLARITRIETEPDPTLLAKGTYGSTPAWAVRLRIYNGTQSVTKTTAWLRSAYDLPSESITVSLVNRDFASSNDFVFISDSVGASVATSAGSGELPTLLNSVFDTATYNTESSRCTVGSCSPATSDGLTVARNLTGTPDVAIVELGYNDTQSSLGSEIDQVMQALVGKGIRVVGWVTMSERRMSGSVATYAAGNRAIRAAATRWPQLRVLDWDGASWGGAKDRWYTDDVHLTNTGQAEFALWLRDRAIELAGGRPGSPQWVVKVSPGVDLRIPILETAGAPQSGVTGVSMNFTVVDPAGEGYLTVWPCGSAKPNTSSLNYKVGQTVANAVVSQVDSTGLICVASNVSAHVIVDVNSWLTSTAGFTPMTPYRLLDTRHGVGAPQAKVGALDGSAGALTVRFGGVNGIPSSGVSAISLNLTATGTSVDKYGGFVTAYPCDVPLPNVSSLNFVNDVSVPNAVIVPMSASGDICFYVRGRADLIVDVNGWFSGGGSFNKVTPQRIADTRNGLGVARSRVGVMNGGGPALAVPVAKVAGIPATGVAAVSVNVTVTGTKANAFGGYVTVYPCGTMPDASTLNFVSGQTVPNAAIARVSAAGTVCIYVYGEADVIVDVNGWFGSSRGFTGMTPVRGSDTRNGLGSVPGK